MSNVNITSAEFSPAQDGWVVECNISSDQGDRSGTEFVSTQAVVDSGLPANTDTLAALIGKSYGLA